MSELRTGYQGKTGAFSERVANRLYPNVPATGYRSFEDLLEAISCERITYGILPCENSIHGSIARAYDLLLEHRNLRIIGETVETITQALIGLQNASLESLTTVTSHPVALEQCRQFFAQYPQLRMLATDDTAGAVSEIVLGNDPRIAAIGPAHCAELYGAIILRASVQDRNPNVTRFFVIAHKRQVSEQATRSCLAVHLADRTGSLHEALGVLARHRLNLRSLLARPNRLRAFAYTFYVEFETPPGFLLDALIAEMQVDVEILGQYPVYL